MRLALRPALRIAMMVAVLAASSCLAAPPSTPASVGRTVREAFTSRLASRWDDFRVCEVHSKTNTPRSFVLRALGEPLVSGVEAIHREELFAREEAGSQELHLGFVVLAYRDEGAADRAYERLPPAESRYLQATLILTRFVALRRGHTVVLLYSETFRDELMTEFLDRVESVLP